MRVLQVDDWAIKAEVSSEGYKLGLVDREVVAYSSDNLRAQAEMEWTCTPTLFTLPIFVIWTQINGICKEFAGLGIRTSRTVTKRGY